MHTMLSRLVATAVGLTIAAAVGGCSSGASSSGSSGSSDPHKAITLAVIPGYNDHVDLNNLYKYVLERHGYAVEFKEMSELATIYAGLARGDIDAFSGAPTSIHKQYWEKYKDKLDDLGPYFDNAAIYTAVPDYVTDVQSLEDLPAHAEELGGVIYGIEPGSGLIATTQNAVFPAYNLGDSIELRTSSTAAMLTELDKAVKAKKPIAVTIWSPFWANSTYDLRMLKDPKEAYGGSYSYNTVANKELAQKFPDVGKMMASLKLTDDQFNTLDDAIYNKFEKGKEQEAVGAWFTENPDLLKQLESHLID